MNRATNSLAGCSYTSRGVPTCSRSPPREDHDAVGHLHRLLLVVRDEDRRHVQVVVQRHQPFAQFLADLGVHRAERLVQQQHAGLGRQRAGDGHPLALAARELVRIALLQPLQPEQLQQLRNPRLGCPPPSTS